MYVIEQSEKTRPNLGVKNVSPHEQATWSNDMKFIHAMLMKLHGPLRWHLSQKRSRQRKWNNLYF